MLATALGVTSSEISALNDPKFRAEVICRLTVKIHHQESDVVSSVALPTPITSQKEAEIATICLHGETVCTDVTKLDYWGRRLEAIDPAIGQLTALVELIVAYNQLRALPVEIGQLTLLKELYLHGNKLRALPAEIGQLTALKMLSVSHNKLSALPAEIGQLTALKKLDLGYNRLSELPHEIGKLSRLKMLWLPDNQLSALPVSLYGLRCECVIQLKECFNGFYSEIVKGVWSRSTPEERAVLGRLMIPCTTQKIKSQR